MPSSKPAGRTSHASTSVPSAEIAVKRSASTSSRPLVNASVTPVPARIRFFAGDGAELAIRDVELLPRSYRALTNVFDRVLGTASDELTIVVETASEEVVLWASTIDNRTGDPVFLPGTGCP